MTTYVKVRDGKPSVYPYHLSDLRAENPNVSFPKELSTTTFEVWGFWPVAPSPKPAPSDGMRVVEGIPVQIDGVWTQQWVEVSLTAQEFEGWVANEARKQEMAAVKADAFVQQFVRMTPQQVQGYVEDNVNSMGEAKALLKKIVLMLHLLAKDSYGE